MRKNTQNMRKTRQNHQNPGLIQKLKVPKWVCRWPLTSFCNGHPFFAILGPARGKIFEKRKKKKIAKNQQNPSLNQKLKVPKWVCRSPLAVVEAARPFFAIFGSARGQIYEKGTKNSKMRVFSIGFCCIFKLFSKYLDPSRAKYREKGWAVTKTGEGRSTNPFWNF